jgi:hypothetical protein
MLAKRGYHMRRLVHDSLEKEEKSASGCRRMPFWKACAAALVLTAGAGCATTSGLTRNDYYISYFSSITRQYGARDTRQYQAAGHTFEVMFLDKTISEIDAATRPMREANLALREGQNGEMVQVREVLLREEFIRPAGSASNGYVSPGTPVRQTLGTVGFIYIISPGQGRASHSAALFFPPSVDTSPTVDSLPGMREAPAAEFAQAFRDITGQELRRVKVLVEPSSEYITAHVIGVDESGRPIGQYRGGYLAFGMTFFPRQNTFRYGLGIIVEPGGPDPVTGTSPNI